MTDDSRSVPSNERAFFECWAKTQLYDLAWAIDGEDDPGTYTSVNTRIAWRVWQGRASMPALSGDSSASETPQPGSNEQMELVRLLNQRHADTGDTLARKAADEIERLRAALSDISDTCEYCGEDARKALSTDGPVVETTCSCPSGDGSLRWPCPVHPPTRRCHCGKFAMHPDMALITDSHAHDHVFDGTPCDCEGEPSCAQETSALPPKINRTLPTLWEYLHVAAAQLVNTVDANHDAKDAPLKWTVPWAQVTALRDAVLKVGMMLEAEKRKRSESKCICDAPMGLRHQANCPQYNRAAL